MKFTKYSRIERISKRSSVDGFTIDVWYYVHYANHKCRLMKKLPKNAEYQISHGKMKITRVENTGTDKNHFEYIRYVFM